MKTFKRTIYSFCVISITGLMLWSCANDYARTDITLEMTDEDTVDAIIDHDLLTVGGTIINIEEPQETHTPVVEYVDEIDITTPEFEEEDISTDIAKTEPDEEIESVSFFNEEESDGIESIELDETVISDGAGSSVDLEEDIAESEDVKIYDEPMKLNDIVVETEDVKEDIKEDMFPSDEDVEKLKSEVVEPVPALGVDELVDKSETKKSLDEFVSPVYNYKRIKVSYPTHTVTRGDTLWSIGRKYGCSISELCAANNINRRKVLSIGQTLTIPISNISSAKTKDVSKPIITTFNELEMPPPVIDKPKKIKSSVTETEDYTVQKGDSYWKIARKYGVNSPELMRINNTASTLIKPGQKIKVPKKY